MPISRLLVCSRPSSGRRLVPGEQGLSPARLYLSGAWHTARAPLTFADGLSDSALAQPGLCTWRQGILSSPQTCGVGLGPGSSWTQPSILRACGTDPWVLTAAGRVVVPRRCLHQGRWGRAPRGERGLHPLWKGEAGTNKPFDRHPLVALEPGSGGTASRRLQCCIQHCVDTPGGSCLGPSRIPRMAPSLPERAGRGWVPSVRGEFSACVPRGPPLGLCQPPPPAGLGWGAL